MAADDLPSHFNFIVTATHRSGNTVTTPLKLMADVDILVEMLQAKGAHDILVADVGSEPLPYEAWASARSKARPSGLPADPI